MTPQQLANQTGFLDIAFSRPVVKRAVRVATIVGIVLAAINHGDRIVHGEFELATVMKILLSFCVPYSVSTYSSVLAIREYRSAAETPVGVAVTIET